MPMSDGDHRMTDESVEVESRVGRPSFSDEGLQERDVMPASWPTNKASKRSEYCCALWICQILDK